VPASPEDRDLVWFRHRDGLLVALRPVHPEDRDVLLEGFGRLSDETRYQRFLAPMDRLTERQLRYLTELDQVNHFAWAAGFREADGQETGVALARYVRTSADPCVAEIAVVVADAYQGRGLGSLLVDGLTLVAMDHGIEELTGFLFGDNRRMLRIFEHLGAEICDDSPGVVRADLPLPPPGGLAVDEVGASELVWVAGTAAHPSHWPCR
jgi:GNAT superfamily N-acetyltransferase